MCQWTFKKLHKYDRETLDRLIFRHPYQFFILRPKMTLKRLRLVRSTATLFRILQMPASIRNFLMITSLLCFLVGSLCAEEKSPLLEGEWIHLASAPENHLRGYYSDKYSPPNWSQEGTCFNLDSDGFGSDLMTKEVFSDFELEFDWKLESGGNSGVLFAIQPGQMYSFMTGLEIQLLDDANHPDGKSELTGLGALYGLSAPFAEQKKEALVEGFNTSRLIVKDGRVKFYLNEILIADHLLGEDLLAKIERSKFKKISSFYKKSFGHILFQDHGGKASFCNIKIRRL
jgi:hypothetical protein